MGIGFSIFLIAVGAVLKWGISASVNGLNLGTIGWILIAVGAIGLVVSVLVWAPRRRAARTVTYDDGYAEPTAPASGHRVVREETYHDSL